MAAITTRATAGTGATVKGSPLTNAEVDTNFINLNTELATKAVASAITGPIESPTYIQMGDGSTAALTAGKLWYNPNTGSFNLGMGGGNITQQVGEELFVYGKASTAISDSPLKIVYQTGTVGASGAITFAPAIAGLTNGDLILGAATESIELNGFGRVTAFGVIHGITTDGAAYGETWANGDTIWYNPATGNPTNIKPVAPNLKVSIGTIIKAGNGGSGSIQIEVNHGSVLGGTDSNVQITTPANGDILEYYAAGGYWRNAVNSGSGGGVGTGTPGSIIFAGTDGSYTQDNANLFWDNTNNRLGVGTTTPPVSLSVHAAGATSGLSGYTDLVTSEVIQPSVSSTEGNYLTQTAFLSSSSGLAATSASLIANAIANNSPVPASNVYITAGCFNASAGADIYADDTNATGVWGRALRNVGSGDVGNNGIYLTGVNATVEQTSVASGAITDWAIGTSSGIRMYSGAINHAFGSRNQVLVVAGAVTNAYGVYTRGDNSSTITNYYDAYLNGVNSADNKWGVYQVNSSHKNFFAGKVGIGTTTPSVALSVQAAGTASPFFNELVTSEVFQPNIVSSDSGFIKQNAFAASSSGTASAMDGSMVQAIGGNFKAKVAGDSHASAIIATAVKGYANRSSGSSDTAQNGAYLTGLEGHAHHNDTASAAATDWGYGAFGTVSVSSGTLKEAAGLYGWSYTESSGTLTSSYGLYTAAANYGGTFTNCYDIYLSGVLEGDVANKWGVYQVNPLHTNFFAGSVGINTTVVGTSKLAVEGVIESTDGGFKFPDGTVQTTASTGGGGGGSGTVTSVAELTLGTTGTDLSSTVANSTTTPVITLNVPTASATNRGVLSSSDWTFFNSKQEALVSGTNIKTINGTSVLGSGDIAISPMSYPGIGIAVSTGSAWDTSLAAPAGSLVGTTATQTLTNKTVTGTKETVYAITDGASVDINPGLGGIQTWTLGASRTPTANSFSAGQSVTLLIDDGATYAITWTTIGVTWLDNAAAPTLQTSGFTIIELFKIGTTVYGMARR